MWTRAALIALALHGAVMTAARAQDAEPESEPTAVENPSAVASFPHSARLDLGADTLRAQEAMVGPWLSAYGVVDRLMVGTFVLPWFATVVAKGSFAGNLALKVRLGEVDDLTVALQAHAFYLHFNDVDRDNLRLRALVFPLRILAAQRWTERLATTLELSAVFSTLTASQLRNRDQEVAGVAAAHAFHVGLVPSYRLLPWLTLFARTRLLLGHAPVVGSANTTLRDGTEVEIRAQTSSRELSSGLSVVAGAHASFGRYTVSAGLGYGTWFIPGLLLPVGHNVPVFELDAHVRF